MPLTKTAAPRQPVPVADRRGMRTMPEALPRAIARRLRALMVRVLLVSWTEGFFWLVSVLCGLVVLQASLDMVFDLPRLVRLLFLIGDLAILGFMVFRFGVMAWSRRLTPYEAAIYAERHWPDLRTGLISAVQLARNPDGSVVLVKALLDEMAGRIAALDLRRAVQCQQRLIKLIGFSVLLVAITGALFFALAPKSLVLVQRIFLINVPLPTETIVVAKSRDFSIPVGQMIELSAKAIGVIPRSGRVEVTYDGRKPEMLSVSPKASSPDVFSLQIPNVQQPLTYRFYLNDGRGDVWTVALLYPPMMSEIHFDVTNPPYSGLPPARLSAGALRLLAGSKLKITGKANQALKSVRLVLSGKPRAVEIKPAGAGRADFSFLLDIPREGLDGLLLELRNDAGIVSQNNTIYAIDVLPDKPPEIAFLQAPPDKANLVAEQKPRLQVKVRDDFKISQVVLCVQQTNTMGEGETPNHDKAVQVPIPMGRTPDGFSLDFEWKDPVGSVDWREGNTFTYWVKAVDNNNVTGPGISYTNPCAWSVVSMKTKREELAEQLRKHAEAIKDLSGTQENLRNQMGDKLKQDIEK